jgi:hypothetical protein
VKLFPSLTPFAAGAALLIGAMGFAPATAQADTILVFGQTGVTSQFQAVNNSDGTTSLSVVNGSIVITGIDPAATTLASYNATFNLTGLSTSVATINSGNLVQNFSGSFAITQGALNILSGNFTDLLTGFGSGAVLTGTTPPVSAVTFTSDIIPAADLDVERALSLSFSNVVPTIGALAPIDGTYPSFTASVSGTFSANNAPPPRIPEPASMALLGSGLIALAATARRRNRG